MRNWNHIQTVILIDAGTWYELETMTCRSSCVDRDRFPHLLHPHRCHSANIFCSMDINYAKFIDVWPFGFVCCCLVCWLFCFGFFTSFKPLIIFEMPVNLIQCVFHYSIPDDTKQSSEGHVICPRDITAPSPQRRKLRLSHANCPWLISQEMGET